MLANREKFCLVFVDLDNLKFVNDTFGHKDGDEYILKAAAVMKTVKDVHAVARIGGDEFMLLVKDVDKVTLENELEILRNSLGQGKSSTGELYNRTFSYGVVESKESWDSSSMLRHADEIMYKYKFAHKKKLKALQEKD